MKSKIALRTKVFYGIVSVFIAITLWYTTSENTNDFVTRTFHNVPVDLINANVLSEKNLTLVDDESYFINILFQGTSRNLDNINETSLKAEADLSQIEGPGRQSVDITVSGFEQNVILEEVLPSTIQLEVSSFTSSHMRPEIITEGKPGEDYVVVSKETDQEVTLDGSEADLSRVSSVSGIVNVNGITVDTTELVEIHAYDSNGTLLEDVTCTPEVVEATISLGVVKTVNITPPHINGEPDSQYQITRVSINPDQLTIAGKPEQIDSINNIEVSSVDIPTTNRNSSFTTESELKFPNGITSVRDITKVGVSVEIEPVINRSYTITDIKETNLAPNLELKSIEPGSVKIQVEGTSAELGKNDASKLRATIDLTGLGAGTHDVRVDVKIEAGKLHSIDPGNVRVEIVQKNS